jgi:hypothetical protein
MDPGPIEVMPEGRVGGGPEMLPVRDGALLRVGRCRWGDPFHENQGNDPWHQAVLSRCRRSVREPYQKHSESGEDRRASNAPGSHRFVADEYPDDAEHGQYRAPGAQEGASYEYEKSARRGVARNWQWFLRPFVRWAPDPPRWTVWDRPPRLGRNL